MIKFYNLRDYINSAGTSNAAIARELGVCDRLLGQYRKPDSPAAVVAVIDGKSVPLYQMGKKGRLSGRVVALMTFREYMDNVRWQTQFAAKELNAAKTIPAIKCKAIDSTYVGLFESGERRLFSRPARRKFKGE